MRGENRRAMEGPQVARLLKRDAFGSVELVDGERGRVVRRIARGSKLVGSRWVARALLRRERRALRRLAGLSGVPALLESEEWESYRAAPSDGVAPNGEEVLLRAYLDGVPLHAAQELPLDFFERLEELVRELHARGVCHNDLHKEPNVLVGADRRPHLLDFQLASVHERRGRAFAVRAREDVRHVEKHRRRYRSAAGGAAEPATPRRSLAAAAWLRLGKPVYNLFTRRLLRLEDAEPRRPRSGPWPAWTPPVGPPPRPGSSPGAAPRAR